jgi:tRNA (guanine37-N1)-methyltransferase
MKFTVLTLFPEMFSSPLSESMLKRAIEKGHIVVDIVDIREYAEGRHKQADDRPYGGGSGMVLMPQPLARALKSVKGAEEGRKERVVLLSPQGDRFDQAMAREFSGVDHLVLVCGRYEGVDERVKELYIDQEASIGDYVLTGGELAALVMIDAVARLIPGVLGDPESLLEESFCEDLLEYPHYTRPETFEGRKVPDVLLSGHHENIRRWRRKESLKKTALNRPDLLDKKSLTSEDRELLKLAMKELEN